MRTSLVLAAISAVALGSGCAKKQEGAGGPGGPGGPPPQVTVANPLVKPIVDWDDYTGRFEAIRETEVRPRVSGYIKSINFRDGQFAHAGQLLFVIDPRPFQAALDQAKADTQRLRAAAEVARTVFARTKTLLEANAVSKEEYENAEAT